MAAQAQAQRDIPVRIQDFSAGYSKDPRQAELQRAQNVQMTRYGSMKSRLGYTALGAQVSGAPAVLGLYEFTRESETARNMLLHSGTLRQYNSSTGVWDTKSAFGGTQTTLFRMTQFKNEFVYVNPDGSFAPRRYDGTTDQAISGAPAGAEFVLAAHNMLFFAKLSRLWFTNVDSWTIQSTNWIDVSPQDGGKITGLSLSQGNVVIWKNGSFQMLFGKDPGSFVLQPVSRQIGNEGSDGPIGQENTIIILFQGRPFAWTGARFMRIGHQLQADFVRLVGAYDGQTLLLWNATDSKVYVRSEVYQHWTEFVYAHTPSCFAVFPSTVPQIYFGSTDGRVFRLTQGTADGASAITTIVHPEDQDMGQPDVVKEVRRVFVEGVGTGVAIDLLTTYGSGTTTTTSLGSSLTLPQRRECPSNYGTKFSVKVTGGSDLDVTAIVAYVRAHRVRQS